VQRVAEGTAASVSLIGDGDRAIALTVNSQSIAPSDTLSYTGGRTPLAHAFVEQAVGAAVAASAALRGLRGYFGVDLVLTASGAVVIEVNPRLTTAYLGVRAAVDENIAALAIDACLGVLPRPPAVRREVQFMADGRVTTLRHVEAPATVS